VVRTRVGYAGGTTENPTYRNIGNHSEAIQIEYNPAQISYAELLEVFWESHDPAARPISQQYASIILYHDEDQRQLATQARDREAARRGERVFTEIRPFSEFYLAESYHQKYWLQQVPELQEELRAIYPSDADFVSSTAVARVNGYVNGNGTIQDLKAELEDLGLSEESQERLLEIVSRLE
jgi:methionine-S-sulfoxide reductase